jgi:hypothetical protein
MASHMDGINKLPRWDPSNPTKYNYDPTNYDAADYAKFKQARIDAQAKQQKATVNRSQQIIKEANKVIKDAINERLKNQGPSRDVFNAAAKAHKQLNANTPSTCFASLSWRDGIVAGEFYRGGSVVYDGEMTLDEFLDFAQSDSLGEWYNANKPF